VEAEGLDWFVFKSAATGYQWTQLSRTSAWVSEAFTAPQGLPLLRSYILALGIGLSTAVFTVADALLLRRLPVHDQDRLVVLWGESRDRAFNYLNVVEDERTVSLKS
jgi:putative ABC transport system permease protein